MKTFLQFLFWTTPLVLIDIILVRCFLMMIMCMFLAVLLFVFGFFGATGSSEKAGLKTSKQNGDSNPDLSDAGVVN